MKRLYSYALAAAFSATAVLGASAAFNRTEVMGNNLATSAPEYIGSSVAKKAQDAKPIKTKQVENPDFRSAKKARKAAAIDATEWTYIGDATYQDGIVYAPYGKTIEKYSVPCYQSTSDENIYMLQDVYPASVINTNGIYQIVDPNEVSTLILDKSEGDDMVSATFTFNVTDGMELSAVQRYYGNFADNKFLFDAKDFFVVYNYGQADQEAYYSAEFSIGLPGSKDYSVAAAANSLCGPDNKIIFSLTSGADVTTAKVFDATGIFNASAANLAVVAQYGITIPDVNGAYKWALTGEGWHTLMFASIDADGNALEGTAIYVYAQPSVDETEWLSLGSTTYNDDTILKLFGVNSAIPAYKVQIYESKSQPGYFRVADIMANNPYASYFDDAQKDHTHYLDINAVDPEAVTIELQPLGAKFQYDWCIESDEAGTLEANKITFPANGLTAVTETLTGAYYANQLGNFGVQIPYNVTVTVTDASGVAIPGAWIYTPAGDFQADENGVATFGLPSETEATFTVYADGYEANDITIAVGSEHVQNLAAALEEATCTINVFANDEEGEPVADAWIYVGADEYQTDENGRAAIEIKGAFGKSFTVGVYKDGYDYFETTVEFTESLEATVMATMVETTCTLSVNVHDEEGEAVEGAFIWVNNDEFTTDAAGHATIELKGAFGKTLTVGIYKDGFEYYETTVEFTELLEAYIFAELETATCTATVYCIDEEYEPVAGAVVSIQDHATTYTTNEFGRTQLIELKGSFGRTHDVTIKHGAYTDHAGQLDFTESTNHDYVAIMVKGEDGIGSITIDEAENTEIYDLNGRRVKNPVPGIYIVNGQKVVLHKK